MRQLINNERFTIRFVYAMKGLGIKTVGSALKFLNKCEPNFRLGNTRVSRLKTELDIYIRDMYGLLP